MRKFGVELELIAPASAAGHAEAHANGIINALGIRSRTASYTGRYYDQYQCKHDGSLRPSDRGVEVVSPIFPARPDSYATIERVVTRLDGEGYGINRSCGMHVHLNVSDLSLRERMLVVLKYAEHQPEISAMLPPSRRSNGYCAPLTDRAALERAIDNNRTDWRPYTPSFPTRASESVNTAFMGAPGDAARLEFRQAAGTCEAAKVIGWVKMLQEMVDEVVRRARLVTAWSVANAPLPRPQPAPVSRNPLAAIPRMRESSDAYRAMMQLATNGMVTTAWAEANGIGRHVLRRIIVGFRRHGAQLTTVGNGTAGPNYVLQGVRTLPVTVREIFLGNSADAQPVAPVVAPAPAPVAPSVAPMTAREFVRYPLTAGFSDETLAWYRSRRDTFAADNNA